ncbi:MAG: hypothetical protein JSS60_02350 [Verrucomicrobia bacterium]|nr:hypothetical protein [Verrucomicrobiota bacterium]
MENQEIAQQSQMMMEQMGKCCMESSCMMKPGCCTTMYLFGILVIAGLAMIIVLQNKMLKEMRKGGKKK